MFCTRCGKQLHEGDAFCANCGAKIGDGAEQEVSSFASVQDDIIFNPPFNGEVPRRRRQVRNEPEIVDAVENTEATAEEKTERESLHFDWNLEGFPAENLKVDDEFKINWDEVVEKKKAHKPISVEKLVPSSLEEDGQMRTRPAGHEDINWDWSPSETRRDPKDPFGSEQMVFTVDKEQLRETVYENEPSQPKTDAQNTVEVKSEANAQSAVESKSEAQNKNEFEVQKPNGVRETEEAPRHGNISDNESGVKNEDAVYDDRQTGFDAAGRQMSFDDTDRQMSFDDTVSQREADAVGRQGHFDAVDRQEYSDDVDRQKHSGGNGGDSNSDEPISIEALEKELFGADDFDLPDTEDKSATIEYHISNSKKKDEKFYTFNAKWSAFQELLDKEKERLDEMERQREIEWESITPAGIDETREPVRPLDFDDVFIEPETPLTPPKKAKEAFENIDEAEIPSEEPQEKTQPDDAFAASGAAKKHDIPNEPEKQVETDPDFEVKIGTDDKVLKEVAKDDIPFPDEWTAEQAKLRYSDVFSAGSFDIDNSGYGSRHVSDEEEIDDDDFEDSRKKKVLKVAIVVLEVIVILEVIILGIKLIAPNSKLSWAIEGMIQSIGNVFSGDDEPAEEASGEAEEAVSTSPEEYMVQYVDAYASSADTIGSVSYDASVKYDMDKEYAFEGIGESSSFDNKSFDSDEEGGYSTYGEAIASSLISYYNEWHDRSHDTDLVGINSLNIGEIRSGDGVYYALNKVIYAEDDGGTVEKYETALLQESGGVITVMEVKEETV